MSNVIVRIYAKTAVNLTTKMGAYCFYFVTNERCYTESKPFKKLCATLVQADCMAYVSALHTFTTMEVCDRATEIHIISDSGVVIELLEVYKSQKNCGDVAAHWREKVKPLFPKEAKLIFKKVSSKIKAGDFDSAYLSKCATIAASELNKFKESYK